MTHIEEKWNALMKAMGDQFEKTLDINSILFLIGIQELGKGTKYFSKEEKQELMHIAVCKILSFSGYYKLIGLDKDGWPHWELDKKLPFLDLLSQEDFLKHHIIEYFEKETNLLSNENH